MADTELVERARAGDKAAFDALARGHSRRLFLTAQRILRDTDAAEDALQVTLTTIWRELPRLRDCERFEAWSYRIVTRAAIAEAKGRRRRHELAELHETVATTPDATARIADADLIARAFDSLVAERRAVVVLRFYADLPMREIGYVLGIPEGTVRSRLSRALAEMRSAMRREATTVGGATLEGPVDPPMLREVTR